MGKEYITTVILALLIVFQIKTWKWRSFISPGFYFGALWILGVIGTQIFIDLGLLPIFNKEYLSELNIYIGFTGICFLLLTSKGRNQIQEDAIKFNFIPSFKSFLYLSSFLLVVAVVTFVSSGASFDMGASRERVHETLANQSIIVGYAQSLSTVLSICAGYTFGKFFLKDIYLSLPKRVIFLFPMIAGLIFSIYLGGRVNFVYSIVEYLIGFSLSLPIKPQKSVNKKVIGYMFMGLIAVSLFISLVAAQRQEHYGGESREYNMVKSNYPIATILYGPMEYMTSSYWGYQLRRRDFVDENNLGYGTYTFNGFINWTLPFAGRVGLEDFSIANMLGIKHGAQDSYDFKRKYYYVTHSCYIPIVQDFGHWGAFPFIFFLVYISHSLFVMVQKRRSIKHAYLLFLFYLFFYYWVKSNYYGFLMQSVLVVLYGFLLIDILNKFNPKSKY